VDPRAANTSQLHAKGESKCVCVSIEAEKERKRTPWVGDDCEISKHARGTGACNEMRRPSRVACRAPDAHNGCADTSSLRGGAGILISIRALHNE
jgi:hypothetical protein